MNRGRGRHGGGGGGNRSSGRGRSSPSPSATPHATVRAESSSSSDVPYGNNDELSVVGRQTSGKTSMDTPEQLSRVSNSNRQHQPGCPLPGIDEDISTNIGNLKMLQNLPEAIDHSPKQISHEKASGVESSENSVCSSPGAPFDICPGKTGTHVVLKAPLLAINRERRNEVKRSKEGHDIRVLRPGMVLLKGYIPYNKQVNIVKKCRELGLGSGGFYQPGYRDGAKLNLKMMCLGKNWDPDTSKYGDRRPIDDAKPPSIPDEFYDLIGQAIQDSHAFLIRQHKVHNVEDILPSMQPNICIVNFYTKSGRLGLHQLGH